METNYPKDDEKTIYLEDNGGISFEQISNSIKEKWGEVNPKLIEITSEYRHVTCLTYDLYDPTDYQNYIIINNLTK